MKEQTEVKEKTLRKKIIKFIIFLTLIIIATILYSRYVGTKGIIVKEYKIKNSDLTEEYYGLKIVHFSDIHYKTTIYKKELEEVVNKINYIKPDIVVFTGDLIDKKTINNMTDEELTKMNEELISVLSKINTTIGKYAIKGEQDYNYEQWDIIMDSAGFLALNDSYDLIYNKTNFPILIGGLSSNIGNTLNITDRIKNIENEEHQEIYSILLMHEPDYIKDINTNNYDLILAGHSHNGQIVIPFIGAIHTPDGANTYYNNYYKINDTKLYISSGLGTTKIKVRLFNHPSINFYRLVNK